MHKIMKTLESFQQYQEMIDSDKITMFVFSADFCPDCWAIKPFMPKLIERYNNMDFIYIDREKFMDIYKELDVYGIPSFVAYRKGIELGRFVSKLRKTEAEIDSFFKTIQ